ncbi:MAG: lipoprotein-releasing system ATP-binding protein LolD [Deltaproteobacteria bacterium]|nr:MAG: lipoprotein-releasing system ATP-binding protein LolD [Deltaproteobacteria bacterium]
MIEAVSLKKSFFLNEREIPVLKGLDFTIKAGERIAICGESGAGKSTLLQIIGSLDKPSSGTITISGTNIFAKPEHELAKWRNQALGFVFQFHHLLPEFTALENVMTPALINGDSTPAARAKAGQLLDNVGLGNRKNHKPGELSGGEQQRVALARALVMQPQALLADEPTGNLDAKISNEIVDLLLECNREFNTTLLLVTHSQRLAARMDRTIVLENGQIL